jgi:plasmid stability protein
MVNLKIKGIDDALYLEIKKLASSENRSVSQEILHITKQYLAKKRKVVSSKTAAEVLIELAGSWSDERSATDIIRDIKKSRRNLCSHP